MYSLTEERKWGFQDFYIFSVFSQVSMTVTRSMIPILKSTSCPIDSQNSLQQWGYTNASTTLRAHHPDSTTESKRGVIKTCIFVKMLVTIDIDSAPAPLGFMTI